MILSMTQIALCQIFLIDEDTQTSERPFTMPYHLRNFQELGSGEHVEPRDWERPLHW
jgi:hypothetical protein